MKINILSLLAIITLILAVVSTNPSENANPSKTDMENLLILTTPSPSSMPKTVTPPMQKILTNDYHIFQTFNNCGPAALFMSLSYYNIQVSQEVLGEILRPYQNQKGDNDDKSVTLEELGEKARDYGLIPYHRPNGSIEILKQFITYDMPVITRTLTKKTEDIGHYRIIKGYDESTSQIIQDDSLQGKDLNFDYDNFDSLWKTYNYEYLVLVPLDKLKVVESVLGEDKDIKTAWRKASENSQKELDLNPGDDYARFNLSVALYNIGEYKKSVEEFEKVKESLPFRTLWYQIEPILAYYEIGNYDKVFEITDKILNNNNRAFSELYLVRGNIYKKQGNINSAREEFEKAVYYNNNLKSAKEALNNL